MQNQKEREEAKSIARVIDSNYLLGATHLTHSEYSEAKKCFDLCIEKMDILSSRPLKAGALKTLQGMKRNALLALMGINFELRKFADLFDILYRYLQFKFDNKDVHVTISILANFGRELNFSIEEAELENIRKKLEGVNDPVALFLLSITYQIKPCQIREKEFEIIENNLSKVFQQIESPYKFFYFGELFRNSRKFDSAFKSYEEFLKLKVNDKIGILSMTLCYSEAGRDRYFNKKSGEALVVFEQGIKFTRDLKIKFKRNKDINMILECAYDDIKIFQELIIFDSEFQRVFLSRNFDELKDSILFLMSLTDDFIEEVNSYLMFSSSLVKKYHIKKDDPLFPLCSREYLIVKEPAIFFWAPKFTVLLVLGMTIAYKEAGESIKEKEESNGLQVIHKCSDEPISKGPNLADEINKLNKYKDIFHGQGKVSNEFAEAVGKVLAFIEQVEQYRSLKEIPKEKEIELMTLLKPAVILDGDLTYSMLKALAEGRKEIKEILSETGKIQEILKGEDKKIVDTYYIGGSMPVPGIPGASVSAGANIKWKALYKKLTKPTKFLKSLIGKIKKNQNKESKE